MFKKRAKFDDFVRYSMPLYWSPVSDKEWKFINRRIGMWHKIKQLYYKLKNKICLIKIIT